MLCMHVVYGAHVKYDERTRKKAEEERIWNEIVAKFDYNYDMLATITKCVHRITESVKEKTSWNEAHHRNILDSNGFKLLCNG